MCVQYRNCRIRCWYFTMQIPQRHMIPFVDRFVLDVDMMSDVDDNGDIHLI